VSAFKFRDPEGHPLEFIAFPDNHQSSVWRFKSANSLYLGIDHSAISVADTERSVGFYQALGFKVSEHSLNQGVEQARLDAVPDATVDVTALGFHDQAVPHLELLCYRGEGGQSDQKLQVSTPNDIAATRLIFRVHTAAAFSHFCTLFKHALLSGPEISEDHILRVLLRDPDNHLIGLECSQPPVAKPG
jgi:catechol 2,3-dioxygenase-like lactoylglutathione lyase family enzyme